MLSYKSESLESTSSFGNARRIVSSSTEDEDSRNTTSSSSMNNYPMSSPPVDPSSPARYSNKLKKHFKSMMGKLLIIEQLM